MRRAATTALRAAGSSSPLNSAAMTSLGRAVASPVPIATTQPSRTPSIWPAMRSISVGNTLRPATVMSSFARPQMTSPSSVRYPRSPVGNHSRGIDRCLADVSGHQRRATDLDLADLTAGHLGGVRLLGVHPDLHAGDRMAEHREAPSGLARVGGDGDLVDVRRPVEGLGNGYRTGGFGQPVGRGQRVRVESEPGHLGGEARDTRHSRRVRRR